MKKKLPLFNRLIDNDRVVLVISLLAAVISWLVVAMTSGDTKPRTIYNVPVNLDLKADALAAVGLIAVPLGDMTVDVNVDGQRTVVGNLKASDLPVTVRVGTITEAGTRDLELYCEPQGEGFSVVGIEPSKVRVQLDTKDSETFDVELDQRGISVPPDHMPGTPVITYPTVTVTGPDSQLERVDRAVAVVELGEDEEWLEKTKIYDAVPITLLDAGGNEIVPEEASLELNYDTVNVVIPVLRIRTIPLRIDFTNKPDDFPTDTLMSYAVVSPKTHIQVAGQVGGLIDSISEIRAGTIDLRRLTPENNTFAFNPEIPGQLDNLENIQTITVNFETEYWITKTFNVGEILVTNTPPGYAVDLLTPSLSVTFVGPDDIVETMTVDDIVAEVRLSDQTISSGSYPFPIRLSAPTKGLVWPAGEYSVVIQAEELNP